MNPVLTPEIREIMFSQQYRPSVSVIMPFEPKMSLKTELSQSLKYASDKVRLELFENYPAEVANLVIQKLESIIRNLNYNTHKKSIAIYVSPVFEKVLYLDLSVEEKIIIDNSFEIRDLVYSKKQLHKYLVLLLSSHESRIYLGDTTSFIRILSNRPESVFDYINDSPERVANFSDPSTQKEILMERFLHHIDHSLDIILNAYHLPLFVLGTPRILGRFKKLTKHTGSVNEYIHGNYEEASMGELKKILQPHIQDWQMVVQRNLHNQLEEAAGRKKLAIGIKEVWHEAMNNKGKLLVVEKNYMHAAEHGGSPDQINIGGEPYNKFSNIKDAVDDVIEKVLQNGGDVEFVDKGSLSLFQHIALIQYY